MDRQETLEAAICREDLSEASRLLDLFPELLAVNLWPIAMFKAASTRVTRLRTAIRIGDTDHALELLNQEPALIHERSPDLGFFRFKSRLVWRISALFSGCLIMVRT